jgi:hypothetical protein
LNNSKSVLSETNRPIPAIGSSLEGLNFHAKTGWSLTMASGANDENNQMGTSKDMIQKVNDTNGPSDQENK